MKVGIILLSTVGLWPLKFDEYPILGKIYKWYGNIFYYRYLVFIMRQFIELVLELLRGDVTRLAQNCSLTLLTLISAARSGVVRSKIFRGLIDSIILAEDRIFASGDPELTSIYKHNVYLSQFANWLFLIVGIITTIPFYFGPIAEKIAYPEQYQYNNETGETPQLRLPLSVWMGYDHRNHYWLSFFYQASDGLPAACYVVYTDAFLFGMMIFPVGQMKLIQHILRNFRHYVLKHQDRLKCSYDEASKNTIRSCILFHHEIIIYAENLNESMKMLMLMDFISCSFQMSILVFQVMTSDINLPMLIALEFLMTMVLQLFLFYWNANEILVESTNIARAIWESEWYKESRSTQLYMQMMMVRSQKPLTLQIGPFYPMTTDTAISILKATYSYSMLLRQSQLKSE